MSTTTSWCYEVSNSILRTATYLATGPG